MPEARRPREVREHPLQCAKPAERLPQLVLSPLTRFRVVSLTTGEEYCPEHQIVVDAWRSIAHVCE